MTGTLYIANISPVTSGAGAIGMGGEPYLNMRSINFYPTDSTGTTVGYLSSTKNGTTSVNGECILSLGNNIVSGTNGNTRGFMRLYSNSQYYTQLCGPTSASSNKNVYLPDVGGTIALTTDLSKYLPLSGGTLTGNLVSNGSLTSPITLKRSDKSTDDMDWYQDLVFTDNTNTRVSSLRSRVYATSGNRALTLGVSNASNVAPDGITIIRHLEADYVYALAPRNDYPATAQIRNIYANTSLPSTTYDGYIYLKY